MKSSKHKKSCQINKKKCVRRKTAKKSRQINRKKSKQDIRRKRRKAAKIKAKADRHRQTHRQKSTSKGFFAIVACYLNKILQIEADFQGKPFEKKANSQFSTADIMKAIICLIIMGISRVYHVNVYQNEIVLASLIGLSKFPSATTIYRFLKKFGTWTFCKRVQRVNRDQISNQIRKAKQKICDGDTSTVQTYSTQKDGSCKGFNKKRPGSFCLQALQYFVNGMSVLPDMLPGNKVPLKAFDTYSNLREVRTICGRLDWIRLDAGFISQKMLSFLDNFSCTGNSREKVKYVVNVGMKCTGAQEAKRRSGCREWIELDKGVMMQDHGLCQIYQEDDKLRRLVLIKEFFSGGKGKGEWKYYALCTNEEYMPAITLYYFYHQRQTIENFFDEAKNDYNLEHLPCTKIMGNALYFNLLCLAFNLLYLFRLDILRKPDHKLRLSTFQRTYLALQMDFDGKVFSIFRSSSFYYRRIVSIFHRLKKFGIVLEYRLC